MELLVIGSSYFLPVRLSTMVTVSWGIGSS
jgi:hypothetical protein